MGGAEYLYWREAGYWNKVYRDHEAVAKREEEMGK